ncbi:pyridoxamine 5'-phosphate oxidase [Acidihalobacter ferrooxydans]|uniref:Pyridoxine/pyridoxamine 5'-phosphate oxidase n=1 Tax=Acidihalobacter ferrooxydans TaxID=1765967 RepID=A0A1P8UDH9_9GAMM|nr:pyridoxamine 5'-phosphate oxidase [Acidihalobacter ferrooxydans]APZ41819.1 pyridoxamine 5'-phosphate oxidase [Acidihalobacter ferrooxydans]
MLDPRILDTFNALYAAALDSAEPTPTAMNLATVDARGRPRSRIVLLKSFDADGFCFYTNYASDKGAEIAANDAVSLCIHWPTLGAGGGTQIRIEGHAERLSGAASDAYFATRPRGSQLGAWASLQSQTLDSRETFDTRYARYEAEFAGSDVPRPPHWGGYRVMPDRVEFWYGANFRLHERVCWERTDGQWNARLLYP